MKKRAIIYGIGNFWRKIKEKVLEQYDIAAYADRNVRPEENILSVSEAIGCLYDVIIIALEDIGGCFTVIKDLFSSYHVPYEKMVLGHFFWENHERLSVDIGGAILYKTDNLAILTENVDEFNNIRSIFAEQLYSYDLGDTKEEIAIDIGMNIGGASLFFLKEKRVRKVYAYEPFEDTFKQAQRNFERNGYHNSERLEIFPYGISDKTEERKLLYNEDMSCGQSTIIETNQLAREIYEKWGLLDKKTDRMEIIQVRDIKEVLEEIYGCHIKENIILKIDCEGEEYPIFKRMDQCGLFNRISVIMMEWHYQGEESLVEILKRNKFGYFNFKQNNRDMGFIYAIKRRDDIRS